MKTLPWQKQTLLFIPPGDQYGTDWFCAIMPPQAMNTLDKHLGQDDVLGRILSNPDDCCSIQYTSSCPWSFDPFTVLGSKAGRTI